ncbi:hypothetical protein BHH84_004828 [Escherichia coli]|nr:hypothetical protein [Escherichia coli]
MTPDQQEQEDFTIADIPSFPDDFDIDDMNQIWWEMNHPSAPHPETRILPSA